ncbi:unnamed protein product, partial [Sphacelaria rigidula]
KATYSTSQAGRSSSAGRTTASEGCGLNVLGLRPNSECCMKSACESKPLRTHVKSASNSRPGDMLSCDPQHTKNLASGYREQTTRHETAEGNFPVDTVACTTQWDTQTKMPLTPPPPPLQQNMDMYNDRPNDG